MKVTKPVETRRNDGSDTRQRILDAAFTVFAKRGFAQASTLEIATEAQVSKRDLYALIGKKEDMLIACVSERATRLKWPHDIPMPNDREALSTVLQQFGFRLLYEVTDPAVISVFRLAISEAERAPEVARVLDELGRGTARSTMKHLFTHAKTAGLVFGETSDMLRQYLALLWGNMMIDLLLHVIERPSKQHLERQAIQASDAFMRLYPAKEARIHP